MLRRSVYRAFSAGEHEAQAPVEPAPPSGRREAIRRLFTELRDEFARRAASASRGRRSFPSPEEGKEDTEEGATTKDPTVTRASPWSVGTQRTLLEGIEFVLETPRGSYRFLDALGGTILVYFSVGEKGGSSLRDVLGVRRDAGGYRPLRKRVLRQRTGFSLTSVRALVDHYLGEESV